jgi:hypothetical protein
MLGIVLTARLQAQKVGKKAVVWSEVEPIDGGIGDSDVRIVRARE